MEEIRLNESFSMDDEQNILKLRWQVVGVIQVVECLPCKFKTQHQK